MGGYFDYELLIDLAYTSVLVNFICNEKKQEFDMTEIWLSWKWNMIVCDTDTWHDAGRSYSCSNYNTMYSSGVSDMIVLVGA